MSSGDRVHRAVLDRCTPRISPLGSVGPAACGRFRVDVIVRQRRLRCLRAEVREALIKVGRQPHSLLVGVANIVWSTCAASLGLESRRNDGMM